MEGITTILLPKMRGSLKKGTLIKVVDDIDKGDMAFITSDPIIGHLLLHKPDSLSEGMTGKGKFSCSCGKYARYKYLSIICDYCGTAVR